jgi:serine/threonine-protein kinase
VATIDPALEAGADGRTPLQVRLALYCKALLLTMVLQEIGSRLLRDQGKLAAPASAYLVLALVVGSCGVTFWVAYRRPRSAATVRCLDIGLHAVLGLVMASAVFEPAVPPGTAFDMLLGMLLVLSMRALIVPSTWQRTLVVGALVSLPTLISVSGWGGGSLAAGVGHSVLIGTFANWAVLAVAYSSVVSGVLRRLRSEVHDAQRLGQYTLIERLGQGGMGVVYRARHAMLRRPTAVKVLSVGESPGGLDRFEREVQQMARLAHPNIVTVYDYGRTSDGAVYYAMELLDGADLQRVVKTVGPLPAARVVHVLIQACRALADAHAAGLVHRDIKPANLFLCRHWGGADTVKVLDFGLVKELRPGPASPLTGEAVVLGTPLYAAPETWTRPADVDARADLYSLGAVAYFLLTGRQVFDGDSAFEVMGHHMHTAPVAPSQRAEVAVPADLEAIVLRCLAKAPDDRYATAELLRAHLEDCEIAGTWQASDARDWWAAHERALARPTVGGSPESLRIEPEPGRFAPKS